MSIMFGPEAKQRRDDRLARAVERADRAQLAADLSRVRGLKVDDASIAYRGARHPIAGAHAAVETSGDLDRRVTATRLVAAGLLAFAWRKTTDRRALYLTVEGDGYAFVVPLDPDRETVARRIAARINALASR